MTELKTAQQRIEFLEHHLSRCRDAFPAPPAGSELEDLWRSAMQTPDGIPAFVEAAMQAGREEWEIRKQLAEELHCWHRLTGNEAAELVALVMKLARPQPAAPAVQLEDGFILVAVKGFDALVCWLDRCADKGHLENCPDLVEPWENFEYRAIAAQQGEKS